MTGVGLASLSLTCRLDDAVNAVTTAVERAAALGADLLCTPEACLPGHRYQPDPVPQYPQEALDTALGAVADAVRRHGVTTMVGTERVTPSGRQILCTVIDGSGRVPGHQAKTQLGGAAQRPACRGRHNASSKRNACPICWLTILLWPSMP